jgi:hypothetical protein
MAKTPAPKVETFRDWLDLLSRAAHQVALGDKPDSRALTLCRTADSAMKVINTAVQVAQMKATPPMLEDLITGDYVPAAARRNSNGYSEISEIERELTQPETSPDRRAFLEGRKNFLLTNTATQ